MLLSRAELSRVELSELPMQLRRFFSDLIIAICEQQTIVRLLWFMYHDDYKERKRERASFFAIQLFDFIIVAKS